MIWKKTHTTLLEKTEFKNFIVRLGKIFSNLSILGLILCFSGILSFAATAFIILMGFVIIILSIGTIFIYIPNFFDLFMSASSVSAQISGFFLQNFYIFAAITILGAIISLVLLLLDKQNKHTARIVISSVVLGIVLISIIVVATGVIK